MLDLVSVPGSDDWWMARLCTRLSDGLPRMKRLQATRDGDALLPDVNVPLAVRVEYMNFMRRARLHVVETLRDARTNRQHVIGFRTAAENDEDGDLEAWRHWRRNRMGVQFRELANDTADFGRAYLLTVRGDDGAIWRPRNEWNTITEQNTLRPWLTEAGITVMHDPIMQADVVTLFRPGYYRMAYRPTRVPTLPTDGTYWPFPSQWTWAGDPIPTPYAPDALLQRTKTTSGLGIWEKHLDTIDRVNEITLNALKIIVMQAFRQRAIDGNFPEVYPEDHPNAGQRINYDEIFKSGPDALWMMPTGAKFWESQVTDVSPVYKARKEEVEILASLTATPLSIFNGSDQNQSAMGAEISREPLTHAVQAMNEEAEVALAQAMAQAFAIDGDTTRANVTDLEVIWGKINPATLSEKAEATAKMGGKPSQRYIDYEVLEMSPSERRRAEQDRADEAFTAALAASRPAAGE